MVGKWWENDGNIKMSGKRQRGGVFRKFSTAALM